MRTMGLNSVCRIPPGRNLMAYIRNAVTLRELFETGKTNETLANLRIMSRQAILALESGTRRPYLYDEMLSLIRLEAARWATNRVGPPTWAQVRDTFLALGKEGLNEHIIEVLNTPGKSTEDAIQFVFDELQRNIGFQTGF